MEVQVPQLNWKMVNEEHDQEAQLFFEHARLSMDLPPDSSTYQLKITCVFAASTLPIVLDLGFELPGMGLGYTLQLDNQGVCSYTDFADSREPFSLGRITLVDNRATLILTRQNDMLWVEFGDQVKEMALKRRGDSFMYAKDTEVGGLGVLVLEEVVLSVPA